MSSEWFRAVVWVGAAGYMGPIRDISIPMTRRLPKWLDQWIISADPDSVQGPYLGDQPRAFLDQLREWPETNSNHDSGRDHQGMSRTVRLHRTEKARINWQHIRAGGHLYDAIAKSYPAFRATSGHGGRVL